MLSNLLSSSQNSFIASPRNLEVTIFDNSSGFIQTVELGCLRTRNMPESKADVAVRRLEELKQQMFASLENPTPLAVKEKRDLTLAASRASTSLHAATSTM